MSFEPCTDIRLRMQARKSGNSSPNEDKSTFKYMGTTFNKENHVPQGIVIKPANQKTTSITNQARGRGRGQLMRERLAQRRQTGNNLTEQYGRKLLDIRDHI